MEMPKIYSYGDYVSNNYGMNAIVVSFEALDLYFSYKTVVAFRYEGKLTVCENTWGTTTGKHLNWIDGGNKKSRLSYEDFQAELGKVQLELGLSYHV